MVDHLILDVFLHIPPPIIEICLCVPPLSNNTALISYMALFLRTYEDLWASIPYLEYAFEELSDALHGQWTAHHDAIFRKSLFVMALQGLPRFLPRLQDHVDFFHPELQYDVMQYDPSTLREALLDLPSSSSTHPSLQHHALINTTPSSMSTPLLPDVDMSSSLISPSFEEGILYTSMDTSPTHLEILAPSLDHHTSSYHLPSLEHLFLA